MLYKFFQRQRHLFIVIILAVVFFVATTSLNYLTQSRDYTKWSSPDETANYFFTLKFSQTGQLAFFDRANIIGDNMVIPRSVRSDFGWIKPVSFLGIILIYGSIARVLGPAVIPYLTPFFAALGLIFFYLIVKRLFSSRVGLWSAFLLAVFPVYIYYTVRSMFHNVLFVVLLLIGSYLFTLALGRRRGESIGSQEAAAPKKTKFLTWSLPVWYWGELIASFASGLVIGLAVITRASELLWLAPAMFIVWLFYIRRLGLTKPLLFIAGVGLALLPAAYYNQILYGSFFYGGYNAMNSSLDDIARTSSALWQFTWRGQFDYYRHYLGQIFRQIFYFGFNSSQSLTMFRHYVLEMFPELLYSGLLGLIILIGQNFRRFQKKYLLYFLAWLILSAILVFYYGSWKFNDNPDLNQFTIGNSYTRYWLPFYLGLMPLAALALVRLSRAILLIGAESQARIRKIIATGIQAAIVLVYVFLSLMFVLYGSTEGLAYLYYNDLAEKVNTENVWHLTEPDSIIITRYYDKFFWPERRVIMGMVPNAEVLTAAAKLIRFYPVYYYNFYLNEADVTYLNSRKLPPYHLELRLVKKTNANFGLYEFIFKS